MNTLMKFEDIPQIIIPLTINTINVLSEEFIEINYIHQGLPQPNLES